MAGFSLIADPSTTEYRVCRTSGSQAYTVGDAVMQDRTSDGVDVIPATSSSITANIYGVCMETVAAAATSVLVCVAKPQQRWKATATNATNSNHNYARQALTDKVSVNNTTDSTATTAVFLQLNVLNSTQIVGSFLPLAAAT